MIAQYISFLMGIAVLILNLYLYKCNKKHIWITVFWLIFWGSYVAFYGYVLFGPHNGVSHDISSFVRLFRNSMLASWFIYNKLLRR